MPTALAPLSEDLIREADGLFLGLLRNALVGVYIIQDNLFRYVSPRFAEILGRSQEEICLQLGPDDLIDARDRETMRRAVADRIDGRSEAAHYSFRVERADGTPIDAEVFGMRTEFGGRPAIIGMMVDITGRRAAERAAREQLNFVSQLVEAIPSPLFHKDDNGRYLGCNKAFEAFVGRPRDEIIGRTVFDLYLYTSDRGTDGELSTYHEWKFPSCKGKPVDGSFKDGEFATTTYKMASRPAMGVSPLEVTRINSLPAVA